MKHIGFGLMVGALIVGAALAVANIKTAGAQLRGQSGEVACACNALHCCCAQASMVAPSMSCQ